MLVIDIRELAQGPCRVDARVPGTDPLFEGVPGTVRGAVIVSGVVTDTGDERYLWRGRVAATVRADCRRCLTPVAIEVDSTISALYTLEADELDDPSVYPLPSGGWQIDLRDAVREELMLAAPTFPLCRDDCRGLCAGCGADLNAATCRCPARVDPRWGPLTAIHPSKSSKSIE